MNYYKRCADNVTEAECWEINENTVTFIEKISGNYSFSFDAECKENGSKNDSLSYKGYECNPCPTSGCQYAPDNSW